MFTINVLGTGSSGNCCPISDGHTQIMVDCGIKISDWCFPNLQLGGVLVTHSHVDHCKYAKALASVYARPIYATAGTMAQMDIPLSMQNIVKYHEPVQIGTLKVIPFPVSHDAAEPAGFFIANQLHESIAFISDTGTMDGVEIDADCYCIEANYDEDTIEGRLDSEAVYAGVHARVTSDFGHLSIQQATEWLTANAQKDATIIMLHRSKHNAPPRIAAIEGYENVHWPDERGRVQVEFGVRDKCPF